MTIGEKIAIKSDKELVLYKEGVFWIAYEEAAYLVSQVKKLKASKKYVKSLQQEVVSVGFPDRSLAEIESSLVLKEKTATRARFEVEKAVDVTEFEKWKQQIELRQPAKPQPSDSYEEKPYDALIEKLASFKLHSATPMSCMLFIEELQREFC
ncbi:MAG: hypothetical protein LIO93_09260 [Bacteroidales bacterium]|nr:hypothetical protein [Bacteroidales bacterium]